MTKRFPAPDLTHMKPARFFSVFLLFCSLLARASGTASGTPQIIRGKDVFEFTYRLTLPRIEGKGRLWLPVARSDSHQKVELIGITTQRPWRLVKEDQFGNRILTMRLTKHDANGRVEVRYRVERREKSAYPAIKGEDVSRNLQPESLVPNDPRLAELARQATRDIRTKDDKAKALYRHTLNRMAYNKSGVGWGRGDALFACASRTGNCTDFHSYFIGLARSIGIPARFAIGFTIPADKNEGRIAGYHCWAEYFAADQWQPVDISEADKHPKLADYYLGKHPANRFQLTLGRDLQIDPAPASGPFNYLVYPYVEAEGKPVPVEAEFHFERLAN